MDEKEKAFIVASIQVRQELDKKEQKKLKGRGKSRVKH